MNDTLVIPICTTNKEGWLKVLGYVSGILMQMLRSCGEYKLALEAESPTEHFQSLSGNEAIMGYSSTPYVWDKLPLAAAAVEDWVGRK